MDRWTSDSNDVAEDRPDISVPELPDDDLRAAPFALVLVRRRLVDPISELQGTHQHLLFNRRQIRAKPQLLADVTFDGAKSVLTIGQPDAPPVVDRQHDQLRPDVA